MSDNSAIEWTDATWQPITGCSIVSPGCTNCYAMKLAGTRLRNHASRAGLTIDTKAGPVWTGEVRFNEQWLLQPLQWKRPRRVFVCAHGDLFAENVPDEWIDKVFAVMALAPQHTFQVLTKRAKRMRDYCSRDLTRGRIATARLVNLMRGTGRGDTDDLMPWPLPNVWLGVSTERQQEADERIPDLLQTPAAVRFISAEPLLGPLGLDRLQREGINQTYIDDALTGFKSNGCGGWTGPKLDWVIVGGESGPDARPMHPDWARSLRDQCAAAEVPFFFKQWGNWHPEIDRDNDDPDWRQPYSDYKEPHFKILNLAGGRGFHGDRVHVMRFCSKKSAGRLLDGVEHSAMPKIKTGDQANGR